MEIVGKLGYFLLLAAFCSACQVKPAQNENANPVASTEEKNDSLSLHPNLIIANNSFLGISPGDTIANHPEHLSAGQLSTGEGDFDVFRIIDASGNDLGYVMPDPRDVRLVRSITIVSPLVTTEGGARVGDTYGSLLDKYPELEVHGSEIESRTYASLGRLMFRISEAHARYELKQKDISRSATILELMIR